MKDQDLQIHSPRRALRVLPGWLFFLLITLISYPKAFAADTAVTNVVGDLGRKETLVFEGLHTFDRNDIINALTPHLEYQLAANPAAPLGNYLKTIEKLILAGYKRNGFPEASVAARVDTNDSRHIIVRVDEGPRFMCGEIKVIGSKLFTADSFKSLSFSKSPAFQSYSLAGQITSPPLGMLGIRRHLTKPHCLRSPNAPKELSWTWVTCKPN